MFRPAAAIHQPHHHSPRTDSMSENSTVCHSFIGIPPPPREMKRGGSPDGEPFGKPAKRAKSSKACHTCRQVRISDLTEQLMSHILLVLLSKRPGVSQESQLRGAHYDAVGAHASTSNALSSGLLLLW